MVKDYYLHRRKNGVFYVEFTGKTSGKKLSARSTGETELLKAHVKHSLRQAAEAAPGRGTGRDRGHCKGRTQGGA